MDYTMPHMKFIKHYRALLVILAFCITAGSLFFYYQERTSVLTEDKFGVASRRIHSKDRLAIRGFSYYGTHEGKKSISIAADSFRIEKKKLGVFRLGFMDEARFKNAVINIYCMNDESPGGITFKNVFSGDSLPKLSGKKRISSIVFEPVSVTLHDDKEAIVSEITADSATIRIKKGEIAFRGNVRVKSKENILRTDTLSLLSEKTILKTKGHYVLTSDGEEQEGTGLTTDIFLAREKSLALREK
jgi:lipopolysaccharide export system protein LptC